MHISNELNNLRNEIQSANPFNREFISDKIEAIRSNYCLSTALKVLFRQQVEAGFVLVDPANEHTIESKIFLDKKTGIRFAVEWNPTRELRKRHQLLIERGILDGGVDYRLLINKDSNNKPCYICKENIQLQNPLEVLLPINLAGVRYFCGANFAPITNNHFTIMTSEHIPQQYSANVLSSMIDIVEKTGGMYKAIYNGRAGASILSHLHLQATTEKLPIEDIIITDKDLLFDERGISILRPFYYLPLYIVSAKARILIEKHANRIIKAWKSADSDLNTQNIIVIKEKDLLKIYIFLRNRTKLIGDGKEGDMGTFECAGNLVLSNDIMVNGESNNERYLFDNASLDMVINLLKQISPVKDILM